MTDGMAPALGRAAFDRPNVAGYRSALWLTLEGQNVDSDEQRLYVTENTACGVRPAPILLKTHILIHFVPIVG